MEVESGIIESGITESGITLSFKLWDGQIIRLAWHNLGDLAPSASIKSVMILSVVITCTILLTARVRGLGIIFTSGQHKLDQARLRAAKHQPYLNKLGVRQIKRQTPVRGLAYPDCLLYFEQHGAGRAGTLAPSEQKLLFLVSFWCRKQHILLTGQLRQKHVARPITDDQIFITIYWGRRVLAHAIFLQVILLSIIILQKQDHSHGKSTLK